MCWSDSNHGWGYWGKVSYPIATGHETVGRVIKIGQKVQKFKIGDLVAHGPFRNSCGSCKYCKKGKDNGCVGMELPERKSYGKYFGGFTTHY